MLTGLYRSFSGDVNGDGYDDLIIGVPYAARCYVMFGTEHGFVNMTEGFTIFGAQPSDLAGWSVSGAGDVNNDIFADMIIGAPNNGLSGAGAIYVIFGGSNPKDVNLAQLTHGEGLVMFGLESHDALGVSVSNVGISFVIKL
jgi:hypothetical protein